MSTTKKSHDKPAADKPAASNIQQLESIFPPPMNEGMLEVFDLIIGAFQELPNADLTDKERRRLMASGTRRYGFLDAASDMAEANPQYYPLNITSADMKDGIRDIELLRNLLGKIREMDRLISNSLFSRSDQVFRMSLTFYNYVRTLAKTGDAGARAIFIVLEPFFRRSRPTSTEPTEAQVLRDVKAGLKGRKDVDLHLVHEKPRLAGGVHFVADALHQSHGAFRETVHGTLCEHCGTENVEHHKFCTECGGKMEQ